MTRVAWDESAARGFRERSRFISLFALSIAAQACSIDRRALSLARANPPPSGVGETRRDQPLGDADAGDPSDGSQPLLVRDGNSGWTEGGTCSGDAESCGSALVVEAAFDRDTESWQAEPGVTLLWQHDDARGAVSSGSLSVSNANTGSASTWVFGAAERCVPAIGNAVYRLRGSAFIPSGQDAGGAGLGVSFFSTTDCTATADATYDSPPTDKVDAWIGLSGETTAPSDAHSLLVRLVIPKPLSEPVFQAKFDDVRVTKR